VDALSLMAHSDTVLSGGGTMVREAAILGTPAYSLFAGKPGALDAALERDGRLTILRTIEEVRNLRFEKNARAFRSNSADARTGEVILQHIIALGKPTAKRVPPLGQMQPSLPGSRSDDTP
jgi:predicted glycosyltransferase